MSISRVTAPDGRTVTHPGTPAQAQAYVALQAMHDTDPRHAELAAILRGDDTSTRSST